MITQALASGLARPLISERLPIGSTSTFPSDVGNSPNSAASAIYCHAPTGQQWAQ